MTDPPASPRTGLSRQAWAVAALFCLLPVAAIGGGLAVAPLLAGCALACLGWPIQIQRSTLPLLLLVAAVWAAASLLWSPLPRPETALKIVAITLSGLTLATAAARLDARGRALARASIIAGVLALTLLLLIEALADMALNRAMQPDAESGALARNPGRGVLILEVFGIAALAALVARHTPIRTGLGVALLAAMAWLSLQFAMEANAVALAFGIGGFALAWVAPRLGALLVSGGIAAWMIGAPWIVLSAGGVLQQIAPQLPLSWAMRLQIWSFTADRIVERPWLGWGLDASRTFEQPQALGGLTYAAIPLHPHSLSLQVWLETGIIGAALCSAVAVAIGRAIAGELAAHRFAAGVATGTMAALGAVWNLSYGAWQEWFLALPFVAAAATLVLRGEAQPA